MPVAPPDHSALSLWDFSLLHYARTDVADLCLRLQDEHGVNVNLLFWCAWLEQRGCTLDIGHLRSAQKRIHSWDEHYVVPLRQLRRRMKVEYGVADVGIELVRSQIKQAELLAEKQLQLWLESYVQAWGDMGITNTNSSPPGVNVRFYLQQLHVADSVITQLLHLLGSRPDSVAQERI
jgi:uncharacterized protein (TIGR02444 family)